ncbi:MAG: hypothetical protein Q7U86_07410 [Draconibacterium sp.]|nr:hypothetical protein [Draconibacterium sp.]
MVIEIRGQQHSPFLPAVPCFALHIMFSSFAFAKEDIRQPADTPAPAGGAELQTCLPVALAQINLPLVANDRLRGAKSGYRQEKMITHYVQNKNVQQFILYAVKTYICKK